ENSDHQALRDGAIQAQRERQQQQQQPGEAQAPAPNMDQEVLPPDERRARVQELSSMMNSQPSETDLIKEVVAMLEDPELSPEDTLQALEALQVLVEPIDNANNMKVLGAISPVVDLLRAEEGTIRAAAAYVVGTAASNNPQFQIDLLELSPDIFSRLRQLLLDSDDEVCNKGLYAVGSLVRNQRNLSHTFLAGGGLGHLESLMIIPRATQADVRIKRKALSVAMDILQVRAQNMLIQDAALARDAAMAQRCCIGAEMLQWRRGAAMARRCCNRSEMLPWLRDAAMAQRCRLVSEMLQWRRGAAMAQRCCHNSGGCLLIVVDLNARCPAFCCCR
ncbi:armadillo-type protein, partial [Dunaliella salina]